MRPYQMRLCQQMIFPSTKTLQNTWGSTHTHTHTHNRVWWIFVGGARSGAGFDKTNIGTSQPTENQTINILWRHLNQKPSKTLICHMYARCTHMQHSIPFKCITLTGSDSETKQNQMKWNAICSYIHIFPYSHLSKYFHVTHLTRHSICLSITWIIWWDMKITRHKLNKLNSSLFQIEWHTISAKYTMQ